MREARNMRTGYGRRDGDPVACGFDAQLGGNVMRFNWLDWVSIVLVIIGALNWGLVGLFNFNLVTFIFGGVPVLVSIIYILVGLAGLYMIYTVSRTREVRAT